MVGAEGDAWSLDQAEVVYFDLAVDSPPTGPPTITIAGPGFGPRELVIRKTLALFGRAEPRDFTDVDALYQRFDRAEILHDAAQADTGFDLQVFIQMLRSHQRLRSERLHVGMFEKFVEGADNRSALSVLNQQLVECVQRLEDLPEASKAKFGDRGEQRVPIVHRSHDITAARTELRYVPEMSLERGLDEMRV